MSPTIIVLPGDGVGPEVMTPAVELLCEFGDFDLIEFPFGGASIDAYGVPVTDEVIAACREADAVLVGAVGGPKWDTTDALAPRPEQSLMRLRRELELYVNLRPIRVYESLRGVSPLRPEVLKGVDLLIVRELTGGIYFGERGRRPDGSAFDVCEYSIHEVERIARAAFRHARHRVTSVDKANVLETSRLWREVVERVHEDEFPEIELRHLLVDNAAFQLIARPDQFDVVLSENLFGDILSDEAAVLSGSIGLLPSASLGDGRPGLFEPVHGSAPDIAGKGVASPLAMFLTIAALFEYGLDMPDAAAAVVEAVRAALDNGLRTHDLGGSDTTAEAAAAVRSLLVATA